MWFLPAIRDEIYGQPCTCTEAEEFPFDLTGISNTGIGGAAKNLTTQAVQGNPTLAAAMNSFDQWENASAEVNATVNSLYQNARLLDSLQTARTAAIAAGNPAPVVDGLTEQVAVATAAFGSATGIPATNGPALQTALGQATRAAAMLGFSNYLVANPIPPVMTCFYPDGEAYLVNALALDWVTLNSTGGVAGFGVDHPNTTTNGFYVAVAFITGFGWFLVAYFAL
jgi:hypothetical protein